MGSDKAQETVRFNEGLLIAKEVLHFPSSNLRTIEYVSRLVHMIYVVLWFVARGFTVFPWLFHS